MNIDIDKFDLVANTLNHASDQLSEALTQIDEALKKRNIGVEVWVPVYEEGGWELGYSKVGNRWGMAIAYQRGLDIDEEKWLIGDSPRFIRADSVIRIPALVEELTAAAEDLVTKIKGASQLAQYTLEKINNKEI